MKTTPKVHLFIKMIYFQFSSLIHLWELLFYINEESTLKIYNSSNELLITSNQTEEIVKFTSSVKLAVVQLPYFLNQSEEQIALLLCASDAFDSTTYRHADLQG